MKNATKKLLLTSLIATCFCSQLALAANINTQQLNRQHGFYAGATAGWAYSSIAKLFSPGSDYFYNGVSWTADMGFDINPYFGIETGYVQMSAMSSQTTGYGVKPFYGAYAAAKVTIPVANQFAVFGKLGGAYVSTSAHFKGVSNQNSGPMAYSALGISYYLTQHLSVNAQYQDYFAGLVNFGVASAGVTYHF